MKLPVRALLIILAASATVYAAILLLWGSTPLTSVGRFLLSGTGLWAVLLCLLNYVLRGLRWRLWLQHQGRHPGWWQGLRFYLSGYTFTPTPANVGEALRGVMLRPPMSGAHSVAIFGAERVADLMALLLLTVPALGWLGRYALQRLSMAQLGIWTVAIGTLLLGAAWMARRHRAAIATRVPVLRAAVASLRHRPLLWLGLTLVAWAAQGLAAWLICRELGIALSPWLACGIYALAMVGGAVSLLPAGLGGTEAILTGLLVLHGAPLGAAAASTVLIRILTLWLAVGLGAICLIYSAAYRKDLHLR